MNEKEDGLESSGTPFVACGTVRDFPKCEKVGFGRYMFLDAVF